MVYSSILDPMLFPFKFILTTKKEKSASNIVLIQQFLQGLRDIQIIHFICPQSGLKDVQALHDF